MARTARHARVTIPRRSTPIRKTATTASSLRLPRPVGYVPVSTLPHDAEGNRPMSLASVTAQQNQASAASQASNTALNSLSSNFGDFLNLLMTQLQNQDPSSPLDTNQFTSELVQFCSVEQQINTNTSLTQLIQLTQSGEIMQASAMTGKQVTVSSNQLALQNGQSTIQFSTPSAEPVQIAVLDASGNQIAGTTMTSSVGTNTWSWNGTNSSGSTEPDGAYKFTVTTPGTGGTTTTLPASIIGTATGVISNSSGLQLELGALTVNFSQVQSVGN
jgi:flagellar basal-body rod modification protein FlgD